MKNSSVSVLIAAALASAATSSLAQSATPNLIRAYIRPVGVLPASPDETQFLESAFATALSATTATSGSDSGVQRARIHRELRAELESFLLTYPYSAYTPAVHVWLGRQAMLRSAYARAMDHFRAAFQATAGTPDAVSSEVAFQSSGGLARLLALTGRISELDNLQADMKTTGVPESGPEWGWAREIRVWVQKHPAEFYKCGLYCLDQLGRLTQPGQFAPQNITETLSSPNGFTVADLLAIGARSGLRLHAAALNNPTNLPVPCVLHLRSEHFLVISERRGSYYRVQDPVAGAPSSMLAEDLADEATGCVILSDAAPSADATLTKPMDTATAALYRGRCHLPTPPDHQNNPCIPDDYHCCPPGSPGGGPGSHGGNSSSSGSSSGGHSGQIQINSFWRGFQNPSPQGHTTTLCSFCGSGMPVPFISEPFLNVWVSDIPLEYNPAYGPPLRLRLAYRDRTWQSSISGQFWHGATFGNVNRYSTPAWGCSLFSFAELNDLQDQVELMFPGGGWATFDFASNATRSSVNYQNNCWLEKQVSGGTTNLVLHQPDGSLWTYSICDSGNAGYLLYYISTQADPFGNALTFTYDSNFYLTNVAAADGTSFTLTHGDGTYPELVTLVATSYGSSASFTFGGQLGGVLTNITDAAGLNSQFVYYDSGFGGGLITELITPYGTTGMSTIGNQTGTGVFDRLIQITNANGTVEFYGMINDYSLYGTDWPDYGASQIPTNTPVGTLDSATGSRQERNTFYWNAQQFAPYVTLDFNSFDWSIFKLGRIRHWLANTYAGYTHFDSLSLEQAPSPDGTAEGQITWYDYYGKPTGVNYEVGTQIMPAVVARVMPDGSTWYEQVQYTTNGLATQTVEKWVDAGTALFRTNSFLYAANGVDLVAWTNALGMLVSSNVYNPYHQVTTNYDALLQQTLYAYDGTTHQLTNVVTPTGLTNSYSYTAGHRLQQVADQPINRTRSYTWNSDGTVFSYTDERGLTVTNFWDGLDRLTGTKYPDGTTTSNLYTRASSFPNSTGDTKILDVTATKDRLGFWTYFDYDSLRRRTFMTNGNLAVTAYGYCDCGALSYITNAFGTAIQQVTINNFDYQGRLTMANYADGYSVTNWFDSLGRVIGTGDGATMRWFFYNNLNLLTTVSNSYGAERLTTYDLLGRPAYVTDANGVTITNTYDPLDRLLTRGHPDGGVEKFGYSAAGLTAYTNQLGLTNFFVYDSAGRKTYETNANWEVIRYTNNAAGDLLSLTDGRNNTTRWVYDEYGRVTNKLDQAGTVILKYKYDPDNRLTNRWSAAKGTTVFAYDPVGNLTNIDYPVSPDVHLSYDALNRLKTMVDAVGTTAYSYTLGNQVLTEDGPFSTDTVTNTYVNRLRTRLDLQQGGGTTPLWTNKFVYDLAGRLTNVTSRAGVFSYTLAAAGPASPLIKRLSLPNTSYITNTFGTVARLTSTILKKSDGTALDSAIYGYNLANQRTAFTNAAGTAVQYAYDRIGQLKVADSSLNTEDRGYNYDASWNLLYLTNSATLYSFTVDSKNEMTADSAYSYTYDSNGNRNYIYNGNIVVMSYDYDDENRLTGITYNDGTQPTATWWRTLMKYDGLGRLRQRDEQTWLDGYGWYPDSTTLYVYDRWKVIQERDGGSTPVVAYTRGTDLSGSLEGAGGIGGLLARSHVYSSGNFTTHNFYHADGNGNVTALVNSFQGLAASYRYDPFGNTISKSGPLADANVYRFSSKEFHANSGLYYYLYRFYDPPSDRWLNSDPAGEAGGINLFRFVLNEPNDLCDPLGLTIPGQSPGAYPPYTYPALPPWPPAAPGQPGPPGNCYDYACDRPPGSSSGGFFYPGRRGGMRQPKSWTCEAMLAGVRADYPGDENVKEVSPGGKCPYGYHKIRGEIYPGGWDFHFKRENPDHFTWSEKDGPVATPGFCNGFSPTHPEDKQCPNAICVPD